jgi:hypothetical protein
MIFAYLIFNNIISDVHRFISYKLPHIQHTLPLICCTVSLGYYTLCLRILRRTDLTRFLCITNRINEFYNYNNSLNHLRLIQLLVTLHVA